MGLRKWLIAIVAVSALAAWSAAGASADPAIWGSPGNGAGQFSEPSEVAVAPDGDVYVADRGNHRIEYFSPAGLYLGQWGTGGAGAGRFGKELVGVAVAASGEVFALDGAPAAGGYAVQRFSSTGTWEAGWGTEAGSGLGQFDEPSGIAVGPNGRVYVAESGNGRVQSFAADGSSPAAWGSGELNDPVGLAVDGSSGQVYVADNSATPQIAVYSATGTALRRWGLTGVQEGEFPPHGLVAIAVGAEGDVYTRSTQLQDAESNRYARFGSSGAFVGEYDWLLGTDPHGLAASEGRLYAPDTGNGLIRVFDLRTPSVSLLAPYLAVGVGQTVHFQSTARVPLGKIVDYEWDLDGDGVYELNSGTTPEVTHVYPSPQKLTASLRVRSDSGVTAVDRRSVEVVVPSPAGPVGVSIDGGATYTNDPEVTVSVRWPEFDNKLMISNDGGFFPATTLPVAAKIPWRLDASGSERQPRTIYVRFGNDNGIGTQTFGDDIILDQTAPKIPAATLSEQGRGRVRVYIRAVDKNSGVGALQLRRIGQRASKWRHFTNRVTLSHLRHGVSVRVRDRAGNDSRWVAVSHHR